MHWRHESSAARSDGGCDITNYFEPDWVAPRYAAARPEIHAAVADYVRRHVDSKTLGGPVLDVGCGTGLSTRPFQTLAGHVVGVDPSASMLAEASRIGGPHYVRGLAEALPFGDAAFSLVTIGCAYHWCEPAAFLDEAIRVLTPTGILVLYDNFFYADKPRASAVFDWLTAEYWGRLPKAPRNPLPEVGSFDDVRFEVMASGFLESWIEMTRELLVLYLTTQSGVVAAVQSGQYSLPEIESHLRRGLAGLVSEEGQAFRFGGPVWVLKVTPG